MAILQFQKPEKVIVNSTTDNYGQFEFRPFFYEFQHQFCLKIEKSFLPNSDHSRGKNSKPHNFELFGKSFG